MAKSANFYGLRKGSTKSHTYSVVDGKQITKDRVEGGKNPRTLSQMTQRCLMSTCSAAYSAMKSICNHSFEEKTAGMQCMREFCKQNYKQLRLAHESGNGFFGFNNYKQSGLVPGSYIISDGSLPEALVDAQVDSVDVTNKKVTLTLTTAANGTIGEVAADMGCRIFGDMCTVAVMYPKADGSYGFGAVRFTYKSGATVLDSFDVAVAGDAVFATPTFTSNTLKVEVRMAYGFATSATAAKVFMAAITSRKVNGNWLRSKAQFTVTTSAPAFAQAIVTYPIGQERFLNGGTNISDPSPIGDSTNTGGSGNTSGGTTGGGGTNPGGGDYNEGD